MDEEPRCGICARPTGSGYVAVRAPLAGGGTVSYQVCPACWTTGQRERLAGALREEACRVVLHGVRPGTPPEDG